MAGMARARPLGHATLLRPLLGIRREELHDYLDALAQPYRRDRSNLDLRFTRNRIRGKLLPHLQRQYNPEVIESLLRLGSLAGEAQAVVDRLVEEWFDRCVLIEGPDTARIELETLVHQPRYLIRELLLAVWRRMGWPLQSMGLAQWDELGDLAMSTALPAKRDFPGPVAVEVTAGEMMLRKFA